MLDLVGSIEPPTVAIREITTADHDVVIGLHDALFPGTHTTGAALVAGHGETHRRLVVESGGTVVGYIAVERQPDGGGYIDFVGVAPSARRKGLGGELVRAGVAELRRLGATTVASDRAGGEHRCSRPVPVARVPRGARGDPAASRVLARLTRRSVCHGGRVLGRRLHLLSAGVTLASMVAYPAGRRGGTARRALSSVVVGGLFATTITATVRRWGLARASSAALVGLVGSGAVEWLGVDSARPFGRYAYSAALRPQLRGVPVIVPMAWVAMAVPAREVAHAALGSRSTPIRRIAGGAVALTAWDLFLDPQMVGEGYWTWARVGHYRSIPVTNFAGWLLVGAAMMVVLEVALPPSDRRARARRRVRNDRGDGDAGVRDVVP